MRTDDHTEQQLEDDDRQAELGSELSYERRNDCRDQHDEHRRQVEFHANQF